MAGLMPEKIRTRRTQIGLNAPMVEWFSGELSEFIMDEVNSADFFKFGRYGMARPYVILPKKKLAARLALF